MLSPHRLLLRIAYLGFAVAILSSGLLLMDHAAPPAMALGQYKILISGDSISQGSSGDYTWRYRLWNKLNRTASGTVSFVGPRTDLYDAVNGVTGSQYYGDPAFTSRSHAALWGTTLSAQIPNIAQQVTSSGANTLVIMLGSNDLAFADTPAQAASSLSQYITEARKANPGIDIVVGQILDRYDLFGGNYTLTSQSASYNSLISSLAGSLNTANSRVVVAPTANGWDAAVHTYDGTHPNPTGETLIAQRVSEGLAAIGIGTSSPNIFTSVGWGVPGPAVSAKGGTEQADLSWNRTSTGAFGMFIELHVTNVVNAWDQLPYAVGGNEFTVTHLAPGGNYEFRILPSKGTMNGLAGPVAAASVTGPTPPPVTSVQVAGMTVQPSAYGNDVNVTLAWTGSSPIASGYVMSLLDRSGLATWIDMPTVVGASYSRYTIQHVDPGRYMEFGVRAVRGFNMASLVTAGPATRTLGVSHRAYASLGDSYSSGLGTVEVDQYIGGECRRTTHAWAYLTQSPWNSWHEHFACAGNTVPQLRAGQLGPARTFLDRRSPKLITLTIGGNDVGFADELSLCVTGNCGDRRAIIEARIDNLLPELIRLFSDLRAEYPYADIVVGGYPGLVEESGGSRNVACVALSETAMIREMTVRLNRVIETAAARAGVWSVTGRVQAAFEGHNACAYPEAAQEWINSWVNGGAGSIGHPNSFHPKDAGQLAYARAFSDEINARSGL